MNPPQSLLSIWGPAALQAFGPCLLGVAIGYFGSQSATKEQFDTLSRAHDDLKRDHSDLERDHKELVAVVVQLRERVTSEEVKLDGVDKRFGRLETQVPPPPVSPPIVQPVPQVVGSIFGVIVVAIGSALMTALTMVILLRPAWTETMRQVVSERLNALADHVRSWLDRWWRK